MRAPSPRRMALILENACSIGVKSGEYGGKKSSWQWRASMAWRMLAGLVGAQIVQHDHLPRPQRRRQLLGDVPGERLRIHGSLDQPGLVQPIGGERGHQRGVLAVVARDRAGGPLVMRRPAIQPGQGDVRAAFVDKDELLWVELGRGRTPGCCAPPRRARWLPVSFFMRPAQAADGPPHRRFTQLLAVVLRPPGAVLQHRGVGSRLQPRPQRRLQLGSNAARVAGNGLALQRARLALLAPRRV